MDNVEGLEIVSWLKAFGARLTEITDKLEMGRMKDLDIGDEEFLKPVIDLCPKDL